MTARKLHALLLILVLVVGLGLAGGQALPKSRGAAIREHEQEMRRRHEIEQREAAARREAAERAQRWRDERVRMREQYLVQEQERAEAEQRAKEKAENEYKTWFEAQKAAGLLDPDCWGVLGGTAVLDACGKCGGDNSSCTDCMGVLNGTAKQDCAGVCGGNDRSCLDCHGVPNGPAVVDECDVCDGDGTSCRDCLGVVKGLARLDACKVCGGDNSTCSDCRGVPLGTAQEDPCGICGGDGTNCCSPLIIKNPNSDPPLLCNGHGTCSARHRFCLCDQGWTGAYCTERQDLCLAMHRQEPVVCSGRGQCNPETGHCACTDPESWMGPDCSISRCNRRGAYDIAAKRCRCMHGYGGTYCERCVSAWPRPGQAHVCVQVVEAWQPVPEDLRLDRSILLGEKDPRAPVFVLMDTSDESAKAFVWGHSYFNAVNGGRRRRDVIWPNSTHAGSGYTYDCACRLTAPASAPQNVTVSSRQYRPRYHGVVPASRVARAPTTFTECQGLLQDILDEFGFSIDVATAEFTDVAAAVDDVAKGCGAESSFAISWFLLAMLSAVVFGGLILAVILCFHRYIRITSPL